MYVFKLLLNYRNNLTILMKKRIDFRVFFSKILDIKVSNVDIACLHQHDKDVETDSEKILIFIFFYFWHCYQIFTIRNLKQISVREIFNGGKIHTSGAGVNDIFLPFRYSIPDTPYSVPAAVGTSELSSLINQILKGTQSLTPV